MRRTDDRLYSILDKTISLIPSTAVHSAITANLHAYGHVSFLRFLKDNWITVIFILVLFFAAM